MVSNISNNYFEVKMKRFAISETVENYEHAYKLHKDYILEGGSYADVIKTIKNGHKDLDDAEIGVEKSKEFKCQWLTINIEERQYSYQITELTKELPFEKEGQEIVKNLSSIPTNNCWDETKFIQTDDKHYTLQLKRGSMNEEHPGCEISLTTDTTGPKNDINIADLGVGLHIRLNFQENNFNKEAAQKMYEEIYAFTKQLIKNLKGVIN